MSSELFHDTQTTTGNTIVETFTTGAAPYVILWALCQSGKSGTFHWVARRMLELGRCKRVYILCGSAEVCLRDQAKLDAGKYNPEYYICDSLQVIFRQDFKKSDMIIKDSLIIIDESHLDQTKGLQLDTFLLRHGLNLTGNCSYAIENNCHILSVSATPYAEVAALKEAERKGESVNKAIVHLTPGMGYVGIEQFLKAKRIQPTFNLTTKTEHEFARFMREPEFKGKYVLMRVKNKIATNTVKRAAKLGKYTYVSYTSAADFDAKREQSRTVSITKEERQARIDAAVSQEMSSVAMHKRSAEREARARARAEMLHLWLGDAPEQTTVVLIKDRLRAGKVVPKQHIGFVWEDALTSKTDTLVQALLGRMCGYYTDGWALPQIFLPKSVIERHEGCVMAQSELERAIDMRMLPREFSHSCPARLSKGGSRTQCVPILLKGFLGDRAFVNRGNNDYNRETKEMCFRRLRALRRITKNAASNPFARFTSAQLTEVDEILQAAPAAGVLNSNLRHLTLKKDSDEGSQEDWFKKLSAAQKAGTSLHGIHEIWKASGENPDLTFAVVYPDYTVEGANPGDVYAIFYTDAPGDIDALNYKHRFGCTDEKELYSPGDAPPPDIWSSSIAAFTGRMSRLCLEDVESFEAFFSKLLVNDLAITELTDEARGYFPFRRGAYAFKTKEDNELTRLCNKLGSEVGMSVHIDFKPGLVRETFRVRKISWKTATA
jgi:hypothetical protein